MLSLTHATWGILLFTAILIALVVRSIRRARQGKEFYVRRIAGIDALEEAIGRTAELGRPLSFTTGLTDVSPTLYASLGVLYYVARRAARYRTRLLLPQSAPDVMAITEDIAREAYRDEGRLAHFDPKSVIFLSSEQFAFAAGYIGMIQREQVASALLFGTFSAESLVLAEAGQQVGAMQVASTVSPEQVAFFICTCDYTLIGEELFAASAYLTREPIQLGSLYGQDRAKFLVFLCIIVGVMCTTARSLFELAGRGDTVQVLDSWTQQLTALFFATPWGGI
jgi:hypothetical protein